MIFPVASFISQGTLETLTVDGLDFKVRVGSGERAGG